LLSKECWKKRFYQSLMNRFFGCAHPALFRGHCGTVKKPNIATESSQRIKQEAYENLALHFGKACALRMNGIPKIDETVKFPCLTQSMTVESESNEKYIKMSFG